MLKVPIIAAALAALAAVSPAEAQPEPRLIGAALIELYSEPNYRGAMQVFYAEEGDLRRQGFNDVARSARVRGAQDWALCEHVHFQGRCVTLSGDAPDLGRLGIYNAVSSLRPQFGAGFPAFGELRLFENEGFAGRSQALREANGHFPSIGFNDMARSLIARGRWEVCEHSDYGGRCRVVEGELPDLRVIGLLGTISSARPADWREPEPPTAPPWGGRPPGHGGASRPDAVGRTAAFFVRPTGYGADLSQCGRDRACVEFRADDFCRGEGYREAAYFRTTRGRFGETLEDVLCVR